MPVYLFQEPPDPENGVQVIDKSDNEVDYNEIIFGSKIKYEGSNSDQDDYAGAVLSDSEDN